MKKRIYFDVDMSGLENVTNSQLREFIEYSLGVSSELSGENPLLEYGPEELHATNVCVGQFV